MLTNMKAGLGKGKDICYQIKTQIALSTEQDEKGLSAATVTTTHRE